VVGKPASIVKAQDDAPKMSLRGAYDVVIWIDLASALINEIAALHFIPLAMTSLKNIAWQAVTRNEKVYISEL
jgi:hypothetical protein